MNYVAIAIFFIGLAFAVCFLYCKRLILSAVAFIFGISPFLLYLLRVGFLLGGVTYLPDGYMLIKSGHWNISRRQVEHSIRKVYKIGWSPHFIIAESRQNDDSGVPIFWILDLEKDLLHGPLTKSNFLKLRVQLGIPDSITLTTAEDRFWRGIFFGGTGRL